MLASTTFFNDVFNFDPSVLTKNQIKALRPIVSNEDFVPEHLMKVSKFARDVSIWVINCVICYDYLNGHPVPKQKKQEPETNKVDLVKAKINRQQKKKEEEYAVAQESERKIESMTSNDESKVMEAAKNAINCLTKGDIDEFKALNSPPALCAEVGKALCILVNNDLKNTSWQDCKKMMSNPNAFINNLKSLDASSITAQ